MCKYFIIICFSFFLFYAGDAQPTVPTKLSYFKTTPSIIDGCEEDYTYDTTSLKRKQYIFITNLQGSAFIRVKGKTISLHRASQFQPAENMHKEIYKGNGYTIIIVTKEGHQIGDEGNYEKGVLEVKHGSEDVTYKIHGMAGC
jgi:hypothetical protein